MVGAIAGDGSSDTHLASALGLVTPTMIESMLSGPLHEAGM